MTLYLIGLSLGVSPWVGLVAPGLSDTLWWILTRFLLNHVLATLTLVGPEGTALGQSRAATVFDVMVGTVSGL